MFIKGDFVVDKNEKSLCLLCVVSPHKKSSLLISGNKKYCRINNRHLLQYYYGNGK